MNRELYADIGLVKCEFDQIWEQQQEGYNFVKRFGQSSIEGMYQEFNSAWVAFFKASFLYLRKEYLLGAKEGEYEKMILAFERVNACEWVQKSEISLSAEVIEILSLPLEPLDEKTKPVEPIKPVKQITKVSQKSSEPSTNVSQEPEDIQRFIQDLQSRLAQKSDPYKQKSTEPEPQSDWGFDPPSEDSAPKPGPINDPRGVSGRNPQRPIAKDGENPYSRRPPSVR